MTAERKTVRWGAIVGSIAVALALVGISGVAGYAYFGGFDAIETTAAKRTSAPSQAKSSESASPTPPSSATVAMPTDCGALFTAAGFVRDPAQDGDYFTNLRQLEVSAAPSRPLLDTGMREHVLTDAALRCDTAFGGVDFSLAVTEIDIDQAVRMRSSLYDAGFECAPAVSGIFCVADLGDHLGETHFFRDGAWVSLGWRSDWAPQPSFFMEDIVHAIYGE